MKVLQFWTQVGQNSDNLLVVTNEEVIAASLNYKELECTQTELRNDVLPVDFGSNRTILPFSTISNVLDTSRMYLEVQTCTEDHSAICICFSTEQTRDEFFAALRQALEPMLEYQEVFQSPIERAKLPLTIAGCILVFAVVGFIGICQEIKSPSRTANLWGKLFAKLVAETIGPVPFLFAQFFVLFVVLAWSWNVGQTAALKPIKILSPSNFA